MTMRHAVFLDGDDTLWRTQEIYDEAKKQFSALMQSVGINDNEIITKLDDLDMQRVPIRGFIVERFTESMLILYTQLSTTYGLQWQAGVEKDIRSIGTLISRPPQLYEDALVALNILRDKTQLYLFSAGKPSIQRRKINKLDINNYFKEVYIVPSKNDGTLRRIIEEIGLLPSQTWLVGNSFRSDILPAVNVGLNAILVARGNWKYDTSLPEQHKDQNYFRVNSLSEATSIILRWLGKE